MKLDWSYLSQLLVSSGVMLALLKWAAPRLLKQVIKDSVQDLYDLTEDHNNRLGKNELTMMNHSKEITALVGTVGVLEVRLAALPRIESSIERISNSMEEISKTVYRMDGKLNG